VSGATRDCAQAHNGHYGYNAWGARMKTMSAKDAKNAFGQLLDRALAEPVTVEKHGRPVVVVLSIEEYERLKRSDDRRLTKTNTARSAHIEES
jgi:prevent-host-death family protein